MTIDPALAALFTMAIGMIVVTLCLAWMTWVSKHFTGTIGHALSVLPAVLLLWVGLYGFFQGGPQ